MVAAGLILVLTAFSALGVPTTNFLAIVGAAGLAVGLALKDSLSNFSSGVMLVFFRPFQVGDHDRGGRRQRCGREHRHLQHRLEDARQPRHHRAEQPRLRRRDHELQRREHAPRRSHVAIGYDADIPQAKSLIAAVVARRGALREAPGARGRRARRAAERRDARRARVGRDARTTPACAATCSSASSARSMSTASRSRPSMRLLPREPDGQQVKESLRDKLMELVERHEEVAPAAERRGHDLRQGPVPRAVEGVFAARAGRSTISATTASSRTTSRRPRSCARAAISSMRALAEEEHKVLVARRDASSKGGCSRTSCRRIPTTTRTCSSRSAPARAATRPRSSPAICSACTAATPSARAGASRS